MFFNLETFDKTRIKLISKNNPDYRKYKKYWKLLLRNEDELDDTKKFYSKIFKTEVTQKYIVTYLINKTNKTLLNSFDYELSNGIVEGINNLIKQVKHNACGYRKFKYFKFIIMLIKGLYNPIQDKKKELYLVLLYDSFIISF